MNGKFNGKCNYKMLDGLLRFTSPHKALLTNTKNNEKMFKALKIKK